MDTGGPSPRAARWLESGLLDVEFYAALRGRDFADATEAAEDLAEQGMARLLSPHPFVDVASLPGEARRAWRQGKVRAVLAELGARPNSPLADADDPDAARARLLALATELGRETADPYPAPDRPSLGAVPPRPGVTTLALVASGTKQTRGTVEAALRYAAGRDVQVLVVDHGSAPHLSLGLAAALRPEVELVRAPAAVSETAAVQRALARASGDVVVVLKPWLRPRRDWLTRLLAAFDDSDVAGAQPVVLGRDDTIECAGLAVPAEGQAAVSLLVGHPPEDAGRLAGRPLAALWPDALALRTDDVVAVGGLDDGLPWEAAALDLSHRVGARRPGGLRVAPGALVSVTGQVPDGAGPRPMPVVADLPADPDLEDTLLRSPGALRWSLKLPSGPGPVGDRWGDTHFGDALAGALRSLGQEVVTARRGAHGAMSHLDDVSLAIRGLHPIPATPGTVNVLWVISHPDDVGVEELTGYDLVLAASEPWARAMAERSGREVLRLLPATEFVAPACEPGTAAEVVFVGAANQERERPLVRRTLEAGVPLAVYGPGWESLPEGVWRADYVDNRELPGLYHRHGIVLADHWPDMARDGFVANRVFDAVACGARVISDEVAGLHEVFDPDDVAVARTPEEVRAAYERFRAAGGRPSGRRTSLSFRDRAEALLDLVTAAVSRSPGG